MPRWLNMWCGDRKYAMLALSAFGGSALHSSLLLSPTTVDITGEFNHIPQSARLSSPSHKYDPCVIARIDCDVRLLKTDWKIGITQCTKY